MPDFTTASAMLLIMSSLTLQANLFHEFQPIGGVSARFADGAGFSCATTAVTNSRKQKNREGRARLIFMQTFYQKRAEIGRRESETLSRRISRSDLGRSGVGRARLPAMPLELICFAGFSP